MGLNGQQLQKGALIECNFLTPQLEAAIPTTDDTPLRSYTPKLTPKQSAWLKDELQRLVEQQIINKSQSHMVSPIVLVPKKDKYRLCINYRQLNKRITIPHTILPNQEKIRNEIANSNFVNIYDLKDAYHLLPIRLEDRHKTAFSTPFGVYEFNRLPFGLASAPHIFQSYIQLVLEQYPHTHTKILVYMDDIYTIHETKQEAQDSHNKFTQFMAEHHMPINKKKSQVAVTSANILGLHVDLINHNIYPTQQFSYTI